MRTATNPTVRSFNSLILQLFETNSLLMTIGESLTAPVKQSSARWRILGRISAGPQTVATVAHTIGYARQSVQRIADILAKEKLVKYIPNPHDKRAQLLTLTPEGGKTLNAINQLQKAWVNRLIQTTDEQVIENTTKSLKIVHQALLEDYKNAFPEKKQVKGGEYTNGRNK